MPDLLSRQPAGEKFFANSGKDSGLLEVDHTLAGEMEEDEKTMYGDHAVSSESFKFLTALEEELDKEWVEQNLGTGKEKIRLNEKGDIYYFDCSNTQITTLPELPAGLAWLYCFSTKITTLPELPAGLTVLDCSFTQISTLPELPAGLTGLYCPSTQISTLPELPACLTVLHCSYTPLAEDIIERARIEAECKAKGIELNI